MSYKPVVLPEFARQLKRLNKKHKSLKADFAMLLASLGEQPTQGEPLGKDCYKVRMAISSKQKGKSGGSRIITCVKVTRETVYLLTVYDKSEREDLFPNELDELLSSAGLK